MNALLPVLYITLLVTAGWAGAGLLQDRATARAGTGATDGAGAGARRVPVVTAVVFVLVVVPSLLQLTVAPGLYETLRRDRTAIAGGEVWRLVTSLVVQDGGWPGALFNLAALAVVGTLAERLWGPARWLVVAVTAQLLGGLWGLYAQPVGGGNSVVNFGLAASLAAAALLLDAGPRARVPAAVSLLAAVALLAAVVLLAVRDIHGGAALAGAAAGAALALARRRSAATGPADAGPAARPGDTEAG